MSLLTPYEPAPLRVNKIVPFSYQDGETYLSTLERLRTHLSTIIDAVNDGFFKNDAYFLDEVNKLIVDVNAAITAGTDATDGKLTEFTETVNALAASVEQRATDLETNVDARADQWMSTQIENNDIITEQIVTDPASATNEAVQALITERVVSILQFGAVADATGVPGVGTDNADAFEQAALSGRAVLVPAGKFRSSRMVPVNIALIGEGGGYGGDLTSGTSMIVFDEGVSGVKLLNRGSTIRDIYLRGGGGATGDGIVLAAIANRVRDCTVHGFGRHGIVGASNGYIVGVVNVDHANVNGLMARANGGNGIHLQGGPDSNAMMFENINSVGNTGWGAFVDAANRNWIKGHFAANIGGGIWDNGNSNDYDVYIEGGVGFTFVMGVNSMYGRLTAPNYARPPINMDLAPNAWQTWNISEQQGGRRSLWLYDAKQGPTPTTGSTYRIDTGGTTAGMFSIVNVTTGKTVFRGDGDTIAFLGGNTVRPFTADAQSLGASAAEWKNLHLSGFNRLKASATPSAVAGSVVVYVKDVGGKMQLIARMPDATEIIMAAQA